MVPMTPRLGWFRGLCALTLLAAASTAQPQGQASQAPRADPLDAQAPVPPATYQSPLAGYRRLGEDRPVPWKEANETVNRIGGWRAYAREAQQPAAAAPSASAPAPAPHAAPAAPAHGGHKTH